eukprot:s2362_g8.t1
MEVFEHNDATTGKGRGRVRRLKTAEELCEMDGIFDDPELTEQVYFLALSKDEHCGLAKRAAKESPPQIFAAMLGGQIAKLTKEALLNSPAFCRFAQQSSTMAQKALTEVGSRRAMTAAVASVVDHLLLLPGNLLRFLVPGLVEFATTLGPLSAELLGSLPEADFQWAHGVGSPSMAEIEQGLASMRDALTSAVQPMVQWRLQLSRGEGVRYDRIQVAVRLAAQELEYFDAFSPLPVLHEAMSIFQIRMQEALLDQTQLLRGTDPTELEASQ